MKPFIGVISDTHGLPRLEAAEALAGAECIIHAGDVGSPEVLDALRKIAPVYAVRGNIDRAAWADALPETEVIEAYDQHIYVLHDLQELDLDPAAAGFQAVIAGHSHRPKIDDQDGVLYFNPGSAGPRRFNLPIALGRLHLVKGRLRSEIIELDVGGAAKRARRAS